MRCVYLEKKEILSKEDMRIHTAISAEIKNLKNTKCLALTKHTYVEIVCIMLKKWRVNELLHIRYSFWS